MSALVLVADGNAERGKRIAEACAARGLSCSVASHGAGALEAALAENPAALVCQLDLPLIDGLRLAAILDANPRTRGLRLAFLDDRPGAARPEGVSGQVFAAPVDPERVAAAVQGLLARQGPEPESGREPGEDGVEGQLSELSLADLIELFHVGRKTGVVELKRRTRAGREVGRIVLRGGDVLHAAVGDAEGVKAFFRLLAWNRGSFSFKPGGSAEGPTLEGSTRMLLREGRRQLEEWARLAVELPPMDARVRLQVERSSLPNVIHPLTQEVLLVLELHDRVGDVVERCSYPDYQVLRTLATLLARGIIEVLAEPAAGRPAEDAAGPFSAARAGRLREWLGGARSRGVARRAKVLVLSPDPAATRDFLRWLGGLGGVRLDPAAAGGAFEATDLMPLARASLEEDLAVEWLQLPVDREFAPLWAAAGHGALAVVLLLAHPAAGALEALAPAAAELAALPRARLFHALLADRGAPDDPDALRRELSPLGEAPLFVIPRHNEGAALAALRELVGRVLP